jgi:transcriptional regulator with XRE-family HTH domain
MATCETRVGRGHHRARVLTGRLIDDLRSARLAANVSQRALAEELGWSHSRYRRFESGATASVTIDAVSVAASVLGLEIGAGLYPIGDGLVDRGHQALLSRFRTTLADSIRVASEIPLMNTGSRSWDLLLRIASQVVGVEAETRVRDAQALTRRIRLRERDGGADVILVVLSDSRHNRAVAADLRQMLGRAFESDPKVISSALRAGRELPGSGVLLL